MSNFMTSIGGTLLVLVLIVPVAIAFIAGSLENPTAKLLTFLAAIALHVILVQVFTDKFLAHEAEEEKKHE